MFISDGGFILHRFRDTATYLTTRNAPFALRSSFMSDIVGISKRGFVLRKLG